MRLMSQSCQSARQDCELRIDECLELAKQAIRCLVVLCRQPRGIATPLQKIADGACLVTRLTPRSDRPGYLTQTERRQVQLKLSSPSFLQQSHRCRVFMMSGGGKTENPIRLNEDVPHCSGGYRVRT